MIRHDVKKRKRSTGHRLRSSEPHAPLQAPMAKPDRIASRQWFPGRRVQADTAGLRQHVVTLRRQVAPALQPGRILLGLLALLAVYLWGFAADRFVSESSFIVRTGSVAGIDEEDMLSFSGGQSAADDTFAIHDFIQSRDMVARLNDRMDLREVFGRGGRDFVFSYPSLLNGESQEEFFDHYRMFVSVAYSSATGVSTLKVEAFEPTDAQRIAAAVLEESESFVNDLNARSRRDSVEDAQRRLEEARLALVETQTALALFRSQELVLDPSKSSYLVLELVGRLSEELARINAQISNLRQVAQNSPQLPALRRQAAAIQQQIMNERQRTAGSSDGLADKIATYERLSVDHDLAVRSVAAAFRSLALAQAQANRQHLYLQRVTQPHLSDHATQPRRMVIFVSAAVLLGLGFMIAWMLLSGLREHKAGLRDGNTL